MGVYVVYQNEINEKRMKEYEISLKQQAELQAQAAPVDSPVEASPAENLQIPDSSQSTEQVNST
jgi:hypothetical protein